MNVNPSITVIGTGKMGSALAARAAKADYRVYLGSRDAQKAKQLAAELNQKVGKELVSGGAHFETVGFSEVIIMAVPTAALKDVLNPLKMMLYRKVLVLPANALNPKDITLVKPKMSTPTAVDIQSFVGPKVRIVTAFQNVMVANLLDLDSPVNCDTFVAGERDDAKQKVIDLAANIGMKAWDIGPLENALASELLTSALLYLNKKHNAKTAGVKVTGLGE